MKGDNEMYKKILFFFVINVLLFVSCKKEDNNNVIKIDKDEDIPSQIDEFEIINNENDDIIPFVTYGFSKDVTAPNGELIRIYNHRKKESPWGPIFSPIIYLYDSDWNVLGMYDTNTLISEDFWPGEIDVEYNIERNSFDMIFSADGIGNYGTGYINLNTYEYVRELETLGIIFIHEMPEIPTREEGSTLRHAPHAGWSEN